MHHRAPALAAKEPSTLTAIKRGLYAPALHAHVLKNPRMTIEEVVAIARNPQASPELLKLVAERSEWMGRATVAEAIARNPKTPNDVGVKALAGCSAEAIRQMAKGIGAPPHIAQAARKRVLG